MKCSTWVGHALGDVMDYEGNFFGNSPGIGIGSRSYSNFLGYVILDSYL
jgi:hypothetical protein